MEGATGTHILSSTEGEAFQDTKRNRSSNRHSRTAKRRERDESGYQEKPSEQVLTNCCTRGEKSQATEMDRASEVNSRSIEHIGKDMSGHIKKPSKQGALTSCRAQREGHVRIQK
jgi:hypothetical protein